MVTFEIEICETNTKLVSVNALSLEEAIAKVTDMYLEGEINLKDGEDVFEDYTIQSV